MIDVKTAVRNANDFLRSMYSGGEVRLEEVIRNDGPPPSWLITLSFIEFPSREYKQLEVDAETGEVKAMRIRQLIT